MEANNAINTAVEFNLDLQADVSAVIELSELQLAFVGGGSGDIII